MNRTTKHTSSDKHTQHDEMSFYNENDTLANIKSSASAHKTTNETVLRPLDDYTTHINVWSLMQTAIISIAMSRLARRFFLFSSRYIHVFSFLVGACLCVAARALDLASDFSVFAFRCVPRNCNFFVVHMFYFRSFKHVGSV